MYAEHTANERLAKMYSLLKVKGQETDGEEVDTLDEFPVEGI